MKNLTELKNKAKELAPIVRIGKNGLTDGVLQEIKNQLKQKKLIKIKLLKALVEEQSRFEIADILKLRTGAELVHVVGNVVILYKKNNLDNNINRQEDKISRR
jgi:RNA-binding protein